MTKIVDLDDASAHLPELIERAAKGEEIILGRAGAPCARLVPFGPDARTLRVPGKGNGRFLAGHGFESPLPDDVLQTFED